MKTILITGSTDGIGKLAAILLAKEGHHLLVHGRKSKKLASTISEIKKLADNENVEGFESDFSDFLSITHMASKIQEKYEKIDVLVNNAGVFKSNVQMTSENTDLRLSVNYLAPVLLTMRLLPLLKKSKLPRLINLSSAAQASVSIEALSGKESLSTQNAYAQSKLALTMWSTYLSGSQPFLNVIAVNPGSLLNTKMVQEAYGQFWSSADKGAQIIHKLATSQKFQDSSGKYFDNDQGQFSRAHPDAYDKEKIAQLISTTNQILKL